MLFRFAISSLLLFFPLFSYGNEEIRVALTTKAHLSSLYLGKFRSDSSVFPTSYHSSLEKILHFDLAHSGFIKLCDTSDAMEKQLQNKDLKIAFDQGKWTQEGHSFALLATLKERQLDLYAFNVHTGTLKQFEGIPLAGEISLDRRQMHKLADAILATLFGVRGVSNDRILYSVQMENLNPTQQLWKAEIWECDFDGGNARQVTYEHDYSITPAFIPGHPTHGNERFLYVVYKNGQPKIYFSSLRGRTGKPLLDLRGNQLLPTVSPKRDRLAFISDAGGRADLFLQDFDPKGFLKGKPKQLFSYPRATQASPSFNPDGSKIAFVSDKDGTPRIYIIESNQEGHKRQNPELITKINRENTCPCWSPDGKKIAYSAKTNGVRQIWIYDLENKSEQQLTTGPGNKENPSWAKDSIHIVFNSTDPDSSELYLVNLNQPEAIKITGGSGKKHYPTWGER